MAIFALVRRGPHEDLLLNTKTMETNIVMDTIRRRRSVRSYSARPVEREKLQAIVEAATWAPTGMNRRTFHFLVVTDAARLQELNRRIKKLEKQIADCEASVEETDAAIAILEQQMSTPEGAADVSLYEKHNRFKKQQEETMLLWEQVSEELERLRAGK